MDREMLRAYFQANPREWAKVAPIIPGYVELIEKIADNSAYSDARFLDFHSRKDAREQVCEADCMKSVLVLFRSDKEHARRQAAIEAATQRINAPGYFSGGAAGPEVLAPAKKAVSEHIILSQEDWDAFNASLDEPPEPNEKLKALLARVPLWDEPIDPSKAAVKDSNDGQ